GAADRPAAGSRGTDDAGTVREGLRGVRRADQAARSRRLVTGYAVSFFSFSFFAALIGRAITGSSPRTFLSVMMYSRGSLRDGSSYMMSSMRLSTSCRRRSEEHTSELQSLRHLVCRLLLEKKKK